MNARLRVLQRVDFHHAAHFSAVLGRDAGGVNVHRLRVVRLDFGAETGRAIVCERNPIDHELRLIFRAARMQNSVPFVEPAGLRIHEVLHGPPRQRRGSSVNCFAADSVGRTGTVRIDERLLVVDDHGRVHGRNAEVHHKVRGKHGTNLNGSRERCKTLLLNMNGISSEREPSCNSKTCVVGHERLLELIPFADELDRAFHSETSRVDHFQAQFSRPALCVERAGK